ncbi:MAG: metal ABC transporter substrate-binding protein [Treponema sp.]|nr:metal ABC transporter substrate-binding protein [Treponema sp.]
MNFKKLLITITMMAAAAAGFAKTKIVTTIFPEYDWTREILGSNIKDAELTLLIGNGIDLHSYQPSIQDIAKISTADIFIYVGGESDDWVEGALENAKNKNMKVINLMEVLGDKVKEEEFIEGMQAEEEHEHEHHDGDHHDEDDHHEAEGHHHHHHSSDEEEVEYDEHVWLSVRNAKILCGEICNALCEADSKNAAAYRENCKAYSAKLDKLDSDFIEVVKNGKTNTLLFGDRFPFRYFVDDYDLKYYAAFVGCSAETEASFETIVFLANKVDELGLNNVCQIESGNGKIAKTIIQSSKKKNAKILTFDSLQSTTTKDVKKGITYLSVMQKNLEILKEALK